MSRPLRSVAIILMGVHLAWWATQEVSLTSDSPGYLADGIAIIERGAPTYFPPGYPLLVAAANAIAGRNGALVLTLMQHLLVVGAACMVFALLRRVTSERMAAAGACAAGMLPTAFMMPQMVMSEALTSFCMVAALYLALRARDTGSLPLAIASGIAAGLATVTRVVPIVALAPALLWILHDRRGSRDVARPVSALLAALCVVAIPLALFARSGSVGLTTSEGFHLFNRVVNEDRQIDTTATATRRLLALTRSDPRGRDWWIVRASPGLDTMSYTGAEQLMGDVAREAIADAPLEWMAGTPVIAARELIGDATPWMWERGVHDPGTWDLGPVVDAGAAPVAAAAASVHRAVWPWLVALAIAGAVGAAWRRRGAPVGALAWIPAGYLLASAAIEYYAPRHNTAIAPFILALAALALDRRTWLPAGAPASP